MISSKCGFATFLVEVASGRGVPVESAQTAEVRKETRSLVFLISKKLQPRALLARSTLSRKRERESEQVGSLSRVLVGEGWGEGDPSTG